MQPSYVYCDVLDTDRTALGGTNEEVKQAQECARRGEAELKMSILCGLTPVFPQTYGWDSAALLDYGANESFEGKSFLWLLKKGFIRFRLRDRESIWDAALAAFEDPTYRWLGAWPEFNTNNPLEDRRPLVEAMRTGKRPAALPDSVWNRVNQLRKLSDAVKQAPPNERELPRGHKLSELIKKAAGVAEHVNPTVAAVLSRCVTEVSDADNRTAIRAFLDAEKRKGQDVPPEVLQITNGCFNAISAECVSAHPVLTLPLSTPVALEVLLRTLPGSRQSDPYEATIVKASDRPELDTVDWHKMQLFLKECGELSTTQKVQEAEAAKLIAMVAVEQLPCYTLRVGWSNALCNAAIWGAFGAAAAAASYVIPGASSAGVAITITSVAGLANALAGGLGSLDFRTRSKNRIVATLEKKWLGLIQTRQDLVVGLNRA